VERRMKVVPPLNNTCLVEATQRHHVSGEHFRIDFTQGKFVLTDRGSMCGTTVNGKTIGGQRRGGHTELHDQDEIAVWDAASQFVFEFRVDSVQLAADATVAPADPDSPGSPFRTTSVRIGARSSPRCTPPVAPTRYSPALPCPSRQVPPPVRTQSLVLSRQGTCSPRQLDTAKTATIRRTLGRTIGVRPRTRG